MDFLLDLMETGADALLTTPFAIPLACGLLVAGLVVLYLTFAPKVEAA